jgi:hypothetical protein
MIQTNHIILQDIARKAFADNNISVGNHTIRLALNPPSIRSFTQKLWLQGHVERVAVQSARTTGADRGLATSSIPACPSCERVWTNGRQFLTWPHLRLRASNLPGSVGSPPSPPSVGLSGAGSLSLLPVPFGFARSEEVSPDQPSTVFDGRFPGQDVTSQPPSQPNFGTLDGGSLSPSPFLPMPNIGGTRPGSLGPASFPPPSSFDAGSSSPNSGSPPPSPPSSPLGVRSTFGVGSPVLGSHSQVLSGAGSSNLPLPGTPRSRPSFGSSSPPPPSPPPSPPASPFGVGSAFTGGLPFGVGLPGLGSQSQVPSSGGTSSPGHHSLFPASSPFGVTSLSSGSGNPPPSPFGAGPSSSGSGNPPPSPFDAGPSSSGSGNPPPPPFGAGPSSSGSGNPPPSPFGAGPSSSGHSHHHSPSRPSSPFGATSSGSGAGYTGNANGAGYSENREAPFSSARIPGRDPSAAYIRNSESLYSSSSSGPSAFGSQNGPSYNLPTYNLPTSRAR